MYDQEKASEKYLDLLTHTDTMRLLFIPYIRIIEKPLSRLLFNSSELSDSLINVFPLWEQEEDNLLDGYVYLVFDNHKLSKCAKEWREFITSDYIEQKWVKSPTPNDKPLYTIAKIYLQEKITNEFVLGNYSKMFSKTTLLEEWPSFRSMTGIKTPVGLDDGEIRLSKAYHVLTRSKLYERVIAKSLGIPYRLFKDQLKELKTPIDLKDERLRLSLLHKQILANG